MKEMLTKESLQEWFDTVERINGARPDALAVWAKIEADREAIRAETREELLRDHFKIGEEIYAHSGTLRYEAVVIAGNPTGGAVMGEWVEGIKYTRRPPKKRNLTNSDMAEELLQKDVGELNKELANLDGDMLKRLCDVLHIPTEVDE